ncbi:TVP38/TMEM64 family protein [Marinitoga litoralis]|uniref:TVP38/TMEM64 family protein n=1 Tax=Marinitoga litoralis TaxID=570855 RepID=UPI00195F3C3B|nr:TVP38/TMEM64 family protein [Marinitoga litoralis]MBM7558260.1 putative membrane protein YdjX (TVP38/TMEM64 family) [Marinitoga litoralis]
MIKKLWKPILLLFLVISMIVLSKIYNFDDKLVLFLDSVDSLGFNGIIYFSLIYIFAVVLGIPGSALTIIAGATFGSVKGVIIVSISSTIGATIAFLISRYFARKQLYEYFKKNEKFIKLDNMVKKNGPIVVAITRLIALFPFNLLNYGFGLTNVSLFDYVFYSWIFMLPGTILYVVGADVITKSISQGKIPWTLIIIFLLAIVFIYLLTKNFKKKLGENDE